MNYSTPNIYVNKLLSSQEEVKEEMIRTNQYDYKKMIEELRFQDSLTKIKKNRLHKVRTCNLIHKTNVHLIKEKIEKAERRRIKSIQLDITEKNRIVEANKHHKLKEKNEDKIKTKNTRIQLEKKGKTKVQLHLITLEEKRLKEEKRTTRRIQLFNQKYNEIHSEKKLILGKKLQENEEKYHKYNQLLLSRENTRRELKEEEILKKYTDLYWKRKEKEKADKQNKQNVDNQRERVKEMKQEREELLHKQKARIIKKIEDMILNKKKKENQKSKQLQLIIQENNDKKSHVCINKGIIRRENSNFRENILLSQREAIGRLLEKEKVIILKKAIAHEKTIVNQIAMEKSLAKFVFEVNRLKSQSVAKRSREQRMKEYKKILNIESEKRKKEIEDK